MIQPGGQGWGSDSGRSPPNFGKLTGSIIQARCRCACHPDGREGSTRNSVKQRQSSVGKRHVQGEPLVWGLWSTRHGGCRRTKWRQMGRALKAQRRQRSIRPKQLRGRGEGTGTQTRPSLGRIITGHGSYFSAARNWRSSYWGCSTGWLQRR